MLWYVMSCNDGATSEFSSTGFCCAMERDVSLQEGDWVQTFCQNHCLSPPYVYPCVLKSPNTVRLYHQQLIFVFSLLCYILMDAPFYSTLLPLPGHDSYFLLQITRPCPLQLALSQWMKLQLKVDVSGTWPLALLSRK